MAFAKRFPQAAMTEKLIADYAARERRFGRTSAQLEPLAQFTVQQRGIDPQDATALIVGGFCQAVLDELPMEFALEAKALLAVSLEGAVG